MDRLSQDAPSDEEGQIVHTPVVEDNCIVWQKREWKRLNELLDLMLERTKSDFRFLFANDSEVDVFVHLLLPKKEAR